MSKYHEKPDVSPKMLHSSVEGNKRYTVEFGERKRVKDTLETAGLRNKKKHKLRQKRIAIERTKDHYGERYDQELDKITKDSLKQMLNRNYKETTDETN